MITARFAVAVQSGSNIQRRRLWNGKGGREVDGQILKAGSMDVEFCNVCDYNGTISSLAVRLASILVSGLVFTSEANLSGRHFE